MSGVKPHCWRQSTLLTSPLVASLRLAMYPRPPSPIRPATVLAAALFLVWPLATPAAAQSDPDPHESGQTNPALTTQSSSEQGVTVKVTPRPASRGQPHWEFAVELDTHGGDLSDDLTKTARLITDDGREFKPVLWTGAAPGGHHRAGVIAFAVPRPWPRGVQLKLERAGEAAPRSFRWEFGSRVEK